MSYGETLLAARKLVANCVPLLSIRPDDPKYDFVAVRREHLLTLKAAITGHDEKVAAFIAHHEPTNR